MGEESQASGAGWAYLGRRPRSTTAAAAAAPGRGESRPPVPGTLSGRGSLLAASWRLRAARGSRPCAVPRDALAVPLLLGALLAGLRSRTDRPGGRQLLNLSATWAEAARAPGSSPRRPPPRPRPRHSAPLPAPALPRGGTRVSGPESLTQATTHFLCRRSRGSGRGRVEGNPRTSLRVFGRSGVAASARWQTRRSKGAGSRVFSARMWDALLLL